MLQTNHINIMAVSVEKFAQSSEALVKTNQRIKRGVETGNPLETYMGLARHVMLTIVGPDYIPDNVRENTNRKSFAQSLQGCIKEIDLNVEERMISRRMLFWDKKWQKTEGDAATKEILPEELMPVAILAVNVVKEAFYDHVIFPYGFIEHRAKTVRKLLEWAYNIVSSGKIGNEQHVREFFGAHNVHKVLPMRKVETNLPPDLISVAEA